MIKILKTISKIVLTTCVVVFAVVFLAWLLVREAQP